MALAPPAAAECGPPPGAAEARPTVASPASVESGARPAVGRSEAGAVGLSVSRPLARSADPTAAQAAVTGAPMPGAVPPRAYRPYHLQPQSGRPLTSDSVAESLEARGFSQVGAIRQRGQSFLAEATGPRGERVRLVLDAASGEISGMQVIGYERRR
ncbi:hypothetical protein ABLE93_17170 [Xanthobacter sp. KR7-65]